jgi:hypothetical protein
MNTISGTNGTVPDFTSMRESRDSQLRGTGQCERRRCPRVRARAGELSSNTALLFVVHTGVQKSFRCSLIVFITLLAETSSSRAMPRSAEQAHISKQMGIHLLSDLGHGSALLTTQMRPPYLSIGLVSGTASFAVCTTNAIRCTLTRRNAYSVRFLRDVATRNCDATQMLTRKSALSNRDNVPFARLWKTTGTAYHSSPI